MAPLAPAGGLFAFRSAEIGRFLTGRFWAPTWRKRPVRLLPQHDCNAEGFRMPVIDMAAGAGAGVRKPRRKEPVGWRARFRRYGDLTELPGPQPPHGRALREGMLRSGCGRGRPMRCLPRRGRRRAGDFSVVRRKVRVCERRRTKPSVRGRHGPSAGMRGDERATIMMLELRLSGCRMAARGRCRRPRRFR